MSGDGREPTGSEDDAVSVDDELYRRLITYSSDLIVILDPDGTMRFTGPTNDPVLGYGDGDLVGENALERVHPDDRDRVRAAFEEILEEPGMTTTNEYRYETATGDWAWIESTGTNRLDDEVIDGIVVVSRDVTDRIRRERALATLHDRTREMLTAETDLEIAELTAEAAKEVLDYPVTVVRLLSGDGKNLEPVAITDEAQAVLGERPKYEVGTGTAGRAFLAGEPMVYEDLEQLEDGYDRGDARAGLFVPIGSHGVLSIGDTEPGALDEEDIQLARILAGNADVALDRLERERELERQNERLEEFASVISHDLRSPLNVASGRLDLLDADPEQVEPIEKAIGRMEELIESVLALARKGQMVDETEPVSLEAIAKEGWMNVATGDGTLAVETDLTIQADPGRLPEVFENLFRNAVDHGGDDVTITVDAIENGFVVEDDGPGIDPEHREKVFESGFSTTVSGHGFGLSIVKQIAEAHGWEVTVGESNEGGARFEFTQVAIEDDD